MECACCTEPFTKERRQKVECHSCDYLVCRECVQTYLQGTVNEAKCMNCNKVWDTNFVCSKMTKTFVKGPLRVTKERVLWEGQLAQLPDAQVEIERRRMIFELKEEIRKMTKEYQKRVAPFKNKLHAQMNTSRKERVKRGFIKACPGEDCKGFLNPDWTCGLCQKSTCKDCNVCIIDTTDEHICLQEDIDTARLLSRETESWPQCGVNITKIDGCDQMWCPQCHVSFSWRTNEIVTGTIHNPHYFQWARTQAANGAIPRQPGDNCANGRPSVPQVLISENVLKIHTARTLAVAFIETLSKSCMLSRHIRAIEIPKYTVPVPNFLEERVKYLENTLTKVDFCRTIYQNTKKREKKLEIRNVLHTFCEVIDTILLSLPIPESALLDIPLYIEKMTTHLGSLKSITDYTNSQLETISGNYGGVRLNIEQPEFDLHWGARMLYRARIPNYLM